MRHALRGLAFAPLALILSCGSNGREVAATPQGERARAAMQDQSPAGQGVSRHEQIVRLDLEFAPAGEGCKLQATPPPEYTAQGRAVHWRVLNGCDTGVTVRLADWRVKGTTIAEFPFVQPESQASCTAGAHQWCRINLTVLPTRPKGETGVWVYSYNLRDGNGDPIVDPEMIIEWF